MSKSILSWEKFTVHGDSKSIEEVERLLDITQNDFTVREHNIRRECAEICLKILKKYENHMAAAIVANECANEILDSIGKSNG
jgi:uncharacterized protein (UPF0147 family)